MAKFNRQIWKNIYFKLLCFNIAFFIFNGFLILLMKKIAANSAPGGYGPIDMLIGLLVFDAIVALIYGTVSYIKTRSVLKPQLIFIVTAIIIMSIVVFVSENSSARVWMDTLRPYINCTGLSCCSAFITMIISKVKKHFSSSKKEDDGD